MTAFLSASPIRARTSQSDPVVRTLPTHSTESQSSFDRAMEKARAAVLGIQKPDGHWCGELQGDTILESEYIMLMAFLGRDQEKRVKKAARYIQSQQHRDGAWSNYPGGPDDISVSVKAYFALKMIGDAPDAVCDDPCGADDRADKSADKSA